MFTTSLCLLLNCNTLLVLAVAVVVAVVVAVAAAAVVVVGPGLAVTAAVTDADGDGGSGVIAAGTACPYIPSQRPRAHILWLGDSATSFSHSWGSAAGELAKLLPDHVPRDDLLGPKPSHTANFVQAHHSHSSTFQAH
jgi:hypothetical protein